MRPLLLAFGLTVALCPLVLVGLRRLNLVDVPDHRSSHAAPTPRGGGIAVAVGATLAGLASPSLSGSARAVVLVTAACFGAAGLLEDAVGIHPLARLAVQVALAVALLPLLLESFDGGIAWLVLFATGTALWVVGYVNAFNFMDGINGLALTQAVVAGAAWYVAGHVLDIPQLASGALVIAGAAAAFAPFNLVRARMFLGDTGSYFVGAWLAALAVVALRAGVPPEAVFAPLALYLVDTGTTLARRAWRRETWYLPHREHVYQQLVGLGWSHARTTAVLFALMALVSALGAVSLTGSVPGRAAADVLLAGVLAAYLRAPAWLAAGRTQPAPAYLP